jgi:hypothetical protein
VQAVGADDEVEAFGGAVAEVRLDLVSLVAEGGERGPVADFRTGGRGQRLLQDVRERRPGQRDEGRRAGHQGLGDDAVDDGAVGRADVDRLVVTAAVEHRLEEPQLVQCPQRRVLQGQPDAHRAGAVLPLDHERLDAGLSECDRRRRTGRAAADDQGPACCRHGVKVLSPSSRAGLLIDQSAEGPNR